MGAIHDIRQPVRLLGCRDEVRSGRRIDGASASYYRVYQFPSAGLPYGPRHFYLLSFMMIGAIRDSLKKRVSIFRTGLSAVVLGSLPMIVAAAYCYAKAPTGMLFEVRAYFERAVVSIAEINRHGGISGAPIDLLLDKSSRLRRSPCRSFRRCFPSSACGGCDQYDPWEKGSHEGRNEGIWRLCRVPSSRRTCLGSDRQRRAVFSQVHDRFHLAGTVAINGIMALLAMYFLQGIAVIAFVLKASKNRYCE